MAQRSTAVVKWFNNKAGYGFLTFVAEDQTTEDIFVHHTEIQVGKDHESARRMGFKFLNHALDVFLLCIAIPLPKASTTQVDHNAHIQFIHFPL